MSRRVVRVVGTEKITLPLAESDDVGKFFIAAVKAFQGKKKKKGPGVREQGKGKSKEKLQIGDSEDEYSA